MTFCEHIRVVTKVICGNPVGGADEIASAIEICRDMDLARHLDKLESATEKHMLTA